MTYLYATDTNHKYESFTELDRPFVEGEYTSDIYDVLEHALNELKAKKPYTLTVLELDDDKNQPYLNDGRQYEVVR